MRSLKIVEDDNAKTDAVSQYQIKRERQWDERYYNNIRIFKYMLPF